MPARVAPPLRVAVLGLGKAGRAQLHWYQRDPRATVAAVWDPSRPISETTAQALKCQAPATWEELVGAPGIDLVSLCGPSSTHAEQACRFLGSGMPVLSEKPMARTLAECDAMVSASLSGDAALFCVFNMRFHPVAEAVRSAIDAIGPVFAADIAYTQHRDDVTWRHRLEQGGGVLKEQAVHAFDLLRLWLGDVTEVAANTLIVHPGREVEDHGEVLLRFRSEGTARVYASYCDPRPELMTGSLVGARGRIDFVLSPYEPTRNAVTLTSNDVVRTIDLRSAKDVDPVYPGLMDATRRLIEFVLDRVADGGPAWIDGREGRAAIEIVAAAYVSDQRKTKVALPLTEPEAVTSGWAPRRLAAGSGQ